MLLAEGVLSDLSEMISVYDLAIEEISEDRFQLFSLVEGMTVDDLIRQDVYVTVEHFLLERLGVEPNDVRYDFKNWIVSI